MARIRTIKPDFWSSAQVVKCSPNARLMFIGMWNFADDNGILKWDALQLKMRIFPGDPFTVDQVAEWLDELWQEKLIGRFSNNSLEYLNVTGWATHQKIDRPSSRHPQPFDADSTIIRRNDPEQSAFALTRKEGRKEGSIKEGSNTARSNGATSPAGAVVPVFISIPLKDGSQYAISHQQKSEWCEAYPGIDVEQELRKCQQWNIANPKNRKTRAGILRHITAWLARAKPPAPPGGGGTSAASRQDAAAQRQAGAP